MIEQVIVNNSAGSLIVLSLAEPLGGHIVQNIEGLDPVKASIVSSSYATMDGTAFQNAKNEQRNIKMRLGLEPNYATETVASLRAELYPFLMPKSKVLLQFYDSELGLNSFDIEGYVESFEAPLFVSDPAVDVSILCSQPDFVAHDETTYSGSSVADSTTYVSVDYDGSVDAGFIFQLDVDRTLAGFTIRRSAPDGNIKTMDFSYPFVSGDTVKVSTVPGDKYVTKTVGGIVTPILYSLNRTAQWINLEPGTNNFNVDTGVGASIDYSIKYHERFGGL